MPRYPRTTRTPAKEQAKSHNSDAGIARNHTIGITRRLMGI